MTGNEYGTFLRQIQENGGQDVMLEMLRLMVQTVLEEGITQHLGAHPHERSQSRRGHRNGYKPRTLKTRMGELSLSVPQARGTEPFEPYPLVKWQRGERSRDDRRPRGNQCFRDNFLLLCYRHGVRNRKYCRRTCCVKHRHHYLLLRQGIRNGLQGCRRAYWTAFLRYRTLFVLFNRIGYRDYVPWGTRRTKFHSNGFGLLLGPGSFRPVSQWRRGSAHHR